MWDNCVFGQNYFQFSEETAFVFQSSFTSLQSHEQCGSVPLSLHPCQHLLPSEFLILAILTGMRWTLRFILICITLKTKNVECSLVVFMTISDFLVENFVQFCIPFLVGLNSLYILDIDPLSDVGLEKIFSRSVGCCFVLLTVAFALQELFSFMRSHLLIVSLRT